jgi:catechol 2,3-dioxygenase-like lactoylglutathione lyase family enzyme
MTSSVFDTHGRIKCGTVATPLFIRSLSDYRRVLGLDVVEEGVVPDDLAEAWAAPDSAGKRYALLQPKSGVGCFVRLVEATPVPGYVPMRSFGWAALEFTVEDVWSLHEDIEADGAFNVVGAPKLVDGFDNFIPMQVRGQADEILYLNKVQKSMSDLDLPQAHVRVDQIFIAVLASPDRQATLDHYVQSYGFEAGATYDIIYTMINDAFQLPANTKSLISMTKVGRLPGVEIDQYPAGTEMRSILDGELPPGVAMVSFGVRSLDAIDDDFITAPVVRDGPLYAGRRTATVMGPADELIELIEVG